MGKQSRRAQRAHRWDAHGGDPWAKGPADISQDAVALSARIAEKSVNVAREEQAAAHGPTVNEMACIRKVAEERVWRTKQAMRQRGALAAKQAADRVWKNRGAEARPLVHPPAITYPVSSRWGLWSGATAAEQAEAERMQEAQIRGKIPLGRLEVRVDEPPPPPPPAPPEGWKPIEWMDTEHYRKLASGPNANPNLKAKLEAFKAEGVPPIKGCYEDKDGIRKPATLYVAPEKVPIKGLEVNGTGDDPAKKRLGTALYRRIVARVPTTTCPDHKVLQVGLRAHKNFVTMDTAGLKALLGKNTEDFDAELGDMVKAILATDEIVEASQRPDNPGMSDNDRALDKEWLESMSPARPSWRMGLKQACLEKGCQVLYPASQWGKIQFRSKLTSQLHEVCTMDSLWETCVLEWRNKPFELEQLVRYTLAFLMYHEKCVNVLLEERDRALDQHTLQMALFTQAAKHAKDNGFADKVLNDPKVGYSPSRQREMADQAAAELMQQVEDEAKKPSKWAKKKAKQKEKARQTGAKQQTAAARWATLAKKLRFAQAKVPAKRTTLELATAYAEEWARRKQRMRWVLLAVKLRHAKVEAAPPMEVRHALAASAARKRVDGQQNVWERGKSVDARMAVGLFDKYLEELLPSDEWHEAHNNREGPWNKMRKLVWKEYSEREEAAAAKAKAEAEAERQRKLEHAERERERAEEAERKAKEAEAEAKKLWEEEQANGGWELTNFPRAHNRKSRGARQREKRRQEKADAPPQEEEEEETKFALQMARALQLSTEEAHASDVHRAQAERLEALGKANVKKAALAPPPPPPPEEEEEADDECLICWNDKATHVTVPCGHQAYCANCVPKDLGNCPMCRGPMTHVIKFFKRGA